MKITVVIPTYNNHDTIGKAIQSVIDQTFFNWELIIINDCSIDNTLSIIEEYIGANPDAEIKLINNNINYGIGINRKIGLDNATGDFITYLDADDYFSIDFLQMCFLLQAQHDSDIVYTSMHIEYPSEFKTPDYNIPVEDQYMTGTATYQIYVNNYMKFFTGNLYRKTLLDSVKFSTKRFAEDVPTLVDALFKAKGVRGTSYSGYNHVFRANSLLSNKPMAFRFMQSEMVDQEVFIMFHTQKQKKICEWQVQNLIGKYNLVVDSIKHNKEIKLKDIKNEKNTWIKYNKWFIEHQDLIKEYGLEWKEYKPRF